MSTQHLGDTVLGSSRAVSRSRLLDWKSTLWRWAWMGPEATIRGAACKSAHMDAAECGLLDPSSECRKHKYTCTVYVCICLVARSLFSFCIAVYMCVCRMSN